MASEVLTLPWAVVDITCHLQLYQLLVYIACLDQVLSRNSITDHSPAVGLLEFRRRRLRFTFPRYYDVFSWFVKHGHGRCVVSVYLII
jgi:hypothetical protein